MYKQSDRGIAGGVVWKAWFGCRGFSFGERACACFDRNMGCVECYVLHALVEKNVALELCRPRKEHPNSIF